MLELENQLRTGGHFVEMLDEAANEVPMLVTQFEAWAAHLPDGGLVVAVRTSDGLEF